MSRFPVIDLSQLQPMKILEALDVEVILNRRMGRFLARWAAHDPPNAAQYDVANLEFDPVKIVQEADSYEELGLRDRVNQAARGVTTAFGVSTDLDAIASRYPGGVPRLPNEPYTIEGDNRYRKRIWLSPNPLSPHGPAGAYEFWALTALDSVLHDVSVIKVRPNLAEDPIILITCLASGTDPKPTTEQLLAIRAYIQAESRLAMTDTILVRAPKVRSTEYRLRVWLFPGPDVATIKTQLARKLQELVVSQYWLGYDHARSAIDAAATLPGVHHVVIDEPAEDIEVPPDWVVVVTKIGVQIVGRTE